MRKTLAEVITEHNRRAFVSKLHGDYRVSADHEAQLAATAAETMRRLGEKEDPNAGWHPVLSDDEMLRRRLERYKLTDTSQAVQLSLNL